MLLYSSQIFSRFQTPLVHSSRLSLYSLDVESRDRRWHHTVRTNVLFEHRRWLLQRLAFSQSGRVSSIYAVRVVCCGCCHGPREFHTIGGVRFLRHVQPLCQRIPQRAGKGRTVPGLRFPFLEKYINSSAQPRNSRSARPRPIPPASLAARYGASSVYPAAKLARSRWVPFESTFVLCD